MSDDSEAAVVAAGVDAAGDSPETTKRRARFDLIDDDGDESGSDYDDGDYESDGGGTTPGSSRDASGSESNPPSQMPSMTYLDGDGYEIPLTGADSEPIPLSSIHFPTSYAHHRRGSALLSTDSLLIQRAESVDVFIPQRTMPKIVDKYILGGKLGEGSYGKVREGFCSATLRRVAIKVMKRKWLRRIPNGEEHVKRELSLLSHLHHEHIVGLYEVLHSQDGQKLYMVLEYCHTNLQAMLERAPELRLPISQCWRYFRDMTHGIDYLHSRGIIHRDIKPGNLLITSRDVLKVSDFGVAEILSPYSRDVTLTTSAGSPAFQAPEVAGARDVFDGPKVDVWSMGVTLYNMATGEYPFSGDSIYTLFHSIANDPLTIPPGVPPALRSLLMSMLEKEPDVRASLQQIKNHPWFITQCLPLPEAPEIALIHPPSVLRTASGHGVTTTLLRYLRYMFPDDETAQTTAPLVSPESTSPDQSHSSHPPSPLLSPTSTASSSVASSAAAEGVQTLKSPPGHRPLQRQLSGLLRKMIHLGRPKKSVPGFESHTAPKSG